MLSLTGAGFAEEIRMHIDFSNPMTIVALVVVALAIIGIVIAIMQHEKKKSLRLQTRFGAEYERVVQEQGTKRKAEAELEKREARVKTLKIQELGRHSESALSRSGMWCNHVSSTIPEARLQKPMSW